MVLLLSPNAFSARAEGAEPVARPTVSATNTPPTPLSRPGRTVPRLGTNDVVGGRLLPFRAPLNAYARAQLGRLGTNVAFISAVLMLPEDWQRTPTTPLLIVCSSSGAPALPQVPRYAEVALAEGWAVLAADGPRLPADRDSVLWNWGTVGSALDYLHQSLPATRGWAVAVGGFSGGAKRAACVAAAAMQARYGVKGVFMGGCNEDKATTGGLLFSAGPKFPATRMFLSNGTEDQIAGPAYGAAVKAAMERSGFSRVRCSTYPGGHVLDEGDLRDALKWFGESEGAAR